MYDVDITVSTKLLDLCKAFTVHNNYVYSLFNECYYNTSKTISETSIKTGDIIFI